MDCPEEWEKAGFALKNLQRQMTTPRVAAALGLLSSQVRELGFEKGLRYLSGLERKDRGRVSLRAAPHRLGKEDIPELEAVWLVLRCECACDFLGQMFPMMAKDGPCQEMGRGWDAARALGWLLTELWHRRSDTWLKLLAMEWAGPFPFYGIAPAKEWE